MSDQLIVHSDQQTWALPLRTASLRLGSKAGMELRVPHPEIIDHAATIDYRGQSALLINKNPFAIFVGSNRVEPNACAPWKAGERVQLTKNVTLDLERSTEEQGGTTTLDENKKQKAASEFDSKQIIQLTVIVVCGLLGCLTMLKGEAAERAATYSFSELLHETHNLQEIETGHSEKLVSALTALQDAHITEIRWRNTNPQRVIRAYNHLLQSALVRRPTPAQEDLASKIKLYGSQQIQAIWSEMDYR